MTREAFDMATNAACAQRVARVHRQLAGECPPELVDIHERFAADAERRAASWDRMAKGLPPSPTPAESLGVQRQGG